MRRFYKDDLIGPYRVVRLLGAGGMGNVYEVVHQKLGVRYALKTFVLEHGKVELLRKKFLAEGKVLARLRHPNLVRASAYTKLRDTISCKHVVDRTVSVMVLYCQIHL